MSVYIPSGEFMLRTPMLTMEDFFALSKESDVAELLGKYYEQPLIKEAIYIASQNLYQSIEKKRTKETDSSLLRYLLRMSTRATPFGLFSAVALGSFGTATKLQLEDQKTIRKRIRPDMEWLALLTDTAEKDFDILQSLKVVANPLSTKNANRIYLDAIKQKISIRTTYLTDYIFELAKESIVYNTLVKTVCDKFPNLDSEKIGYLIKSLFDQKYLISELTPSLLTLSPHKGIMDQLTKKFRFHDLDQLMDEYNQTAPGNGFEKLSTIVNQMKEMKEAPHYIQVDSAMNQNELKLNEQVSSEISKVINFCYNLFPVKGLNYLNDYYEKFIDKYNRGEFIPLREVVDENLGIGLKIPDQDVYDDSKSAEWNAYLKRKLLESYLNKENALMLPDVLPFISERDPENALPLIEVYCDILTSSKEQLDKGDFRISIHSLANGGTFGRFTDILNSQDMMTQLFRQEAELEPNSCFVESSFLPQKSRTANVAIHPNFRAHEINLNFPSKAPESAIDLDDIYIGADHERLILVSKKLNKEINVSYSNMLNPGFAPPILRLIRDISRKKYSKFNFWDWGALSEFPYLPRVCFRKSILSPATWKLEFDPNTTLESLIKKWNIPRYVYMTFYDNRILLDLTNKVHLGEVEQELKSKKRIILTECIEIDKHQWIKSSRGSHACEFVIPFIRNPKYAKHVNPQFSIGSEKIDPSIKLKSPGGDWLYAKIYLPQDRQEDFIYQHLAPFADSIVQEGEAKRWFYIRYIDHNHAHHIRLRFHGDPMTLSQKVLKKFHDWSAQMMQGALIRNVELACYEREIKRYGGVDLIDSAEEVFSIDSTACTNLLRAIAEKRINLPIHAIAALNSVDMLYHLGLSLEEQIDFFKQINPDKKYLEGFKKDSHTLAKMTPWIFSDDVIHPNDIAYDWACAIYCRQPILNQFRLKSYKNSIYQSFIHMHCNRLMGPDLEKEKRALAYAQNLLKAVSAYIKVNC